MTPYLPGYIELYKTGELKIRIESLNDILKECKLCPRECGVNRIEGEIGVCKGGVELMVSSVLHILVKSLLWLDFMGQELSF